VAREWVDGQMEAEGADPETRAFPSPAKADSHRSGRAVFD
jgi:hypothetical protein